MPTILHISDLHRDSADQYETEQLIAAISSDSNRWESEKIPRPDLVVVSGDLVRGVPSDLSDPGAELGARYQAAGEFLDRLAEEVLGADRSRVVIVPGNHDVYRGDAIRAMTPLNELPDDLEARAFEPQSGIRWNWRDRRAYQIVDQQRYDARLRYFRKFRQDFYSGLDPNPIAGDDVDLVCFEFQTLGLIVVGFASWHGNDGYCPVGEINPAAISSSQQLLSTSDAPLAIAVWHHSVKGGPRTNDYMDARAVHSMIDFGFSVGLHGHQHFASAAPFELLLPNSTKMAVIGSGSLSFREQDLPTGELRQYNIVNVDPESESLTVHFRSMSPNGVFMGSHRDDFGGNTYATLGLPPSPSRPNPPTENQLLDEAASAVAAGEFVTALSLVERLGNKRPRETRQIEIEAYAGLEMDEELLVLLASPQTVGEAVMAISTLLNTQQFGEAESRLCDAKRLIPQSIYEGLVERIAVGRMFS